MNNELYYIINDIIYNWDPLRIPYCPYDEYSGETKDIIDIMISGKGSDGIFEYFNNRRWTELPDDQVEDYLEEIRHYSMMLINNYNNIQAKKISMCRCRKDESFIEI